MRGELIVASWALRVWAKKLKELDFVGIMFFDEFNQLILLEESFFNDLDSLIIKVICIPF